MRTPQGAPNLLLTPLDCHTSSQRVSLFLLEVSGRRGVPCAASQVCSRAEDRQARVGGLAKSPPPLAYLSLEAGYLALLRGAGLGARGGRCWGRDGCAGVSQRAGVAVAREAPRAVRGGQLDTLSPANRAYWPQLGRGD